MPARNIQSWYFQLSIWLQLCPVAVALKPHLTVPVAEEMCSCQIWSQGLQTVPQEHLRYDKIVISLLATLLSEVYRVSYPSMPHGTLNLPVYPLDKICMVGHPCGHPNGGVSLLLYPGRSLNKDESPLVEVNQANI